MIYGHNDVGPVPDTPEPPVGHPAKHDICKSLLDMDNNFTVVILPDQVLEDPYPDTYKHTPTPVVGQLITLDEDIPASLYMEEDVTGVVRRAQGDETLHRSPPTVGSQGLYVTLKIKIYFLIYYLSIDLFDAGITW